LRMIFENDSMILVCSGMFYDIHRKNTAWQWKIERGRWRCCECHAVSACGKRRQRERCFGFGKGVASLPTRGAGGDRLKPHRSRLSDPLVWCSACGLYVGAEHKPRQLLLPCSGACSNAGTEHRRRQLKSGLHLVKGTALGQLCQLSVTNKDLYSIPTK
jgi:hypothetical protein